MLRTSVTPAEVAAFLTELAAIDPDAVKALVNARVPCNDVLAGHPTVQVGERPDGTCEVGLLGVLNGIFGTIERGERRGWGCIYMSIPEDPGAPPSFVAIAGPDAAEGRTHE